MLSKKMPLSEDQEGLKSFLIEAITVLCKNSLKYRNEFTIEGLLGITLDSEEVFLVNINEQIESDRTSSSRKGTRGISVKERQRGRHVQRTLGKRPLSGDGNVSEGPHPKKQMCSSESSEDLTRHYTEGKFRVDHKTHVTEK